MVVGTSREGETFHRNNPSPLTDQLYLSAARALSGRVLLDLGITCIINATLELPTMAYQNQDSLQIAVEDRVASKLYVYFDLVADKIHSVHEQGKGTVMIYCRAGMSRSASLCIAYFIKYHGMTTDEAYDYVRARRPIIHPNVGFMRQLRDFERKLRPGSTPPMFRRHNSMPLSFAAECCSNNDNDGMDDYEKQTKVIKPSLPRKPRIRLSEMFDLAAETYQTTVVQICDVRTEDDNAAIHEHLDNAHVQLPEPLNAPMSRCPTPMETTADAADAAACVSNLSKTPFTKISGPGKIAVSFVCCWLESESDHSLIPSSSSVVSTNVTACSSFNFTALAEPMLALPQITQEVVHERLGNLPQALAAEEAKKERRYLISVIIAHPAAVKATTPTVLDCLGVFQRTKTPLLNIPFQPQPIPRQQKKTTLSRTASSRASIKLPGLKISPRPQQIHALATLELGGLFATAIIQLPPLFLEGSTFANERSNIIKPYLIKFRKARAIVSAPFLGIATTSDHGSESGLELAIKEPNRVGGMKIAWLLAISRRTIIASEEAVAILMPQIMHSVEKLAPSAQMPSKKFPYYSLVPRREAAGVCSDLHRAKEEQGIESCWFFSLAPRKSTKTVCMIPRNEVVSRPTKKRPPAIQEIDSSSIQWASERYDVDVTSRHYKARDMADIPYAVLEGPKISLKAQRAVSVATDGLFPLDAPLQFTKPSHCEYSAWNVTSVNFWPLYGSCSASHQVLLEMNNLYMEPMAFKEKCKVSKHIDGKTFKLAPVNTHVDLQDDSVELLEIPDVVGDISVLKHHLMKMSDPSVVSIWLEVFKRSVINARPIYPFVALAEMLPVAEQVDRQVLLHDEDDDEEEEIGRKVTGRCESALPTFSCMFAMTCQTIVTSELCDDYFLDCMDSNPSKLVTTTQFELVTAPETEFTVTLEATFLLTRPMQFVLDFPTYAVGKITGPLRPVAAAEKQYELGHAAVFSQSVPTYLLGRQPFRILTNMRQVAWGEQVSFWDGMGSLPKYEFVSDIEDTADISLHKMQQEGLDQVVPPADTYWFFDHTAAASEKPIDDFRTNLRPTTPLPANFQLFLPDPELADMVGTESTDVFKKDTEDVSVVMPIFPAESVADLIQGSVKTRHKVEKRVSFREPTPEKQLKVASGTAQSMVSYQRPRTRSQSRKRLVTAEVGTKADHNTSAMLSASVKQANNILDRKRDYYGSSQSSYQTRRYNTETPRPTTYTAPEEERGRSVGRRSQAGARSVSVSQQQSLEVASSSSPSGGKSLRGLLDIASKWIGGSARASSPSRSPASSSSSKRERSRSSARLGRNYFS